MCRLKFIKKKDRISAVFETARAIEKYPVKMWHVECNCRVRDHLDSRQRDQTVSSKVLDSWLRVDSICIAFINPLGSLSRIQALRYYNSDLRHTFIFVTKSCCISRCLASAQSHAQNKFSNHHFFLTVDIFHSSLQ